MEINFNPSIRQLRTFGLASLAGLPLAAALWSRGSLTSIEWAGAAGMVLALLAIVWPRSLRPLLVALNVLTWPLLLILNDAVLLVAFYLVIVPVGLVFRFVGRDALQLKIDRAADSYWQPKRSPADVRSYFRRW